MILSSPNYNSHYRNKTRMSDLVNNNQFFVLVFASLNVVQEKAIILRGYKYQQFRAFFKAEKQKISKTHPGISLSKNYLQNRYPAIICSTSSIYKQSLAGFFVFLFSKFFLFKKIFFGLYSWHIPRPGTEPMSQQ